MLFFLVFDGFFSYSNILKNIRIYFCIYYLLREYRERKLADETQARSPATCLQVALDGGDNINP